MRPRSRGRRDREDRSGEPFAVGEIVGALLEGRELARVVPVGRLAVAWPEIVGERLAAVCAPARLEGGTLVVQASSGPWGAQVRFLAEEIGRRANRALGREAVRRVHVVVAPADRAGGPKPL